jgi:hypothetical protein
MKNSANQITVKIAKIILIFLYTESATDTYRQGYFWVGGIILILLKAYSLCVNIKEKYIVVVKSYELKKDSLIKPCFFVENLNINN